MEALLSIYSGTAGYMPWTAIRFYSIAPVGAFHTCPFPEGHFVEDPGGAALLAGLPALAGADCGHDQGIIFGEADGPAVHRNTHMKVPAEMPGGMAVPEVGHDRLFAQDPAGFQC